MCVCVCVRVPPEKPIYNFHLLTSIEMFVPKPWWTTPWSCQVDVSQRKLTCFMVGSLRLMFKTLCLMVETVC